MRSGIAEESSRRITPVVEDRPQAIKVGLWDTLEEIAALDRQPLAESRRSFACHTGEARAAITSTSTCGCAASHRATFGGYGG
jgi:hypothetical protein